MSRTAVAPGKEGPAQPSAIEKEFFAKLEAAGIGLDREGHRVTVPCVVHRPRNDLEFLLVHRSGKTHEALLVTECQPSLINAALIAIGLERGRNIVFEKKKPFPTEAELERGVSPYVAVPPQGGAMYLTVAFSRQGGRVELPVAELLLDWHENRTVGGARWTYLGGRDVPLNRGEPPVFVADHEGNLISVCYKQPANHLATMVHPRAGDEMNWQGSKAVPPPGTAIQLIFHRSKPESVARREAMVAKRPAPNLAGRPDRNPAREEGDRTPKRDK